MNFFIFFAKRENSEKLIPYFSMKPCTDFLLACFIKIDDPVFVAADTMDCYIQGHLDDLKELLEKIDCLIINEDEARMLAAELNLITAGKKILAMGLDIVIVKKGDSGSIMCNSEGGIFILPAYPADEVKDPTGAGDSFAGGFMGYLAAKKPDGDIDFELLKTAVAYGTVGASFTISNFSLQGIASVSKTDIDSRVEILRKLTHF